MIPTSLEKLLANCFRTISFNQNKDGNLSVKEWEIGSETTPEIEYQASYVDYTFTVVAIFERSAIQQKILDNKEFFNNLKMNFVIVNSNTEKIEDNRIKLTMTLMQAVSSC
jgi:hypothetical protein